MEFGGAFGHCLAGDFETVLDVMGVCVRLSGCAVEPTEFAVNVTDIGWIEMSIDIEIGRCTVKAASDSIGQLPQRRQIGCSIQCHAIVE